MSYVKKTCLEGRFGYMVLALRKAMSDTNIDLGVTVKDGIKGVSETPEKECGGGSYVL